MIAFVVDTNRDYLVNHSSLPAREITNRRRAEFAVRDDEHAPVGDALENGAVPSDALHETLERTAAASRIRGCGRGDEIPDFERLGEEDQDTGYEIGDATLRGEPHRDAREAPHRKDAADVDT